MRQQLVKNENINILVVEDDYSSFLLIKEYLTPFDFNIYRSINDKETWEILNTNIVFQLVVMDVKLFNSKINGIDLSREIKKKFPTLSIIIQTAEVNCKNQIDSIVGVYDDFITKPYEMNCFLNKISKLLEKTVVLQFNVK